MEIVFDERQSPKMASFHTATKQLFSLENALQPHANPTLKNKGFKTLNDAHSTAGPHAVSLKSLFKTAFPGKTAEEISVKKASENEVHYRFVSNGKTIILKGINDHKGNVYWLTGNASKKESTKSARDDELLSRMREIHLVNYVRDRINEQEERAKSKSARQAFERARNKIFNDELSTIHEIARRVHHDMNNLAFDLDLTPSQLFKGFNCFKSKPTDYNYPDWLYGFVTKFYPKTIKETIAFKKLSGKKGVLYGLKTSDGLTVYLHTTVENNEPKISVYTTR
ncbi:hypothetical protein HUU53_02070 [Candidatus Micrarchaeota archaeon]|nr:hypothetical protein [Candidatus Micrarchaeota archaeon]